VDKKAFAYFWEMGWRLYHLKNKKMLWICRFAHGFYVTSTHAEVLYKTTDYYAPPWERTIAWNDPTINIDWPLQSGLPLLSPKDEAGKLLSEAEVFE
jgi:dTDP-4-dehydrorhamnose 3,5-epimerase